MNPALAGLVILIIGDSHMAHPDYLMNNVYEPLTGMGAKVYAYGSCGAKPEDYLLPRKVDCGRASRVPGKPAVGIDKPGQPTWNLKELLAQVKPNLVVVELGDPMGGYTQPALNRAWVAEQVSSLTAVLREANVACDWVGPPWGTEGGSFGKTYPRVQELSQVLAANVPPCHYIDTTAMAKPGDWGAFDGQHLVPAGYQAWGAALAQAIAAGPLKPPAGSGAPAASDLIGP